MHNLATTRDVADRLGISVRQVARLAGSGALKPALKLEGVRGAMLFDMNVNINKWVKIKKNVKHDENIEK